jgi:DNA-binding CsgD family transcriptional regulator
MSKRRNTGDLDSMPTSNRSKTSSPSSKAAKTSAGAVTHVETLGARFGFTKTESAVALALVEGLSYAEVADKLCVSYHTVHTHIKAIHHKAGASTTARLAAVLRDVLEKPK